MGREFFIRHRLRLAEVLTLVGLIGLWSCARPPNRTYDEVAPTPTLTQPAGTQPTPSGIRSPATQPSSSRTTPFTSLIGSAFAATATDEGRDVGPSRGITSGTSASPERVTDPGVVQSIRNALQSDASFSPQAKAIQVTAEKGVITLKGTVATDREKNAVAVKAQQIAGNAFNVDNQLIVRTPEFSK